jgi:uncharacterized coiled-coil protein SlyX
MTNVKELEERVQKQQERIDKLVDHLTRGGRLMEEMRDAIEALVNLVEEHRKANVRARPRECDQRLYAKLDVLELKGWGKRKPC